MPCCNFLNATNVVVVPNVSMTITVQPIQQFENGEIYTLRLGNDLPPHTGTEAVIIVSGATTVPCLIGCVADITGNTLRAGRIRGLRRYRIQYGADAPHFSFLDKLCCFQYSATPTIDDEP